MPVATKPDQLKQLLGWMQTKRSPYEDTLQEITDLFMPYRGDITTRHSPGVRRRPLYDSYGVTVATRAHNFLNGSLFPASSDWAKLRIPHRPPDFDKVTEVALDDTAKRLMDAFSDSNFYPSSENTTRDWMVIGNTSSIALHDDESAKDDESFGGLIFQAIPFSRVWWSFSHLGRPNVIIREIEMTAWDAYHFFQQPGDRVPQFLRDKYAGDPYSPVGVYHYVQRDPKGKIYTGDKPWKSMWTLREDPNVVIRSGGFDLQPYVCARMMLMDGEQYGRGLGHIARPQMKGCNELTRQEMMALGKEVNPPFMSEEDSIIAIDLTPGGHAIVRPPREMAPGYIRSGTDFQLVELVRDNMHKIVSDAFLGDALGEPESQDRSAEATRARQARALARLSSTGQTLAHELLGPTVENAIHIMMKRNALPELQELLDDQGDLTIKPVFTSPFFTAQKAQALLRIDAFLEKRLQRFERTQDPQHLDDIDWAEIRNLEHLLADVDAGVFKDPEEIEEIATARGDRATDEEIARLTQGRDFSTQVQLRPGSRASSAGDLLTAGVGS